ncbi:MAG: ferredoxin--nitrite reductase [Chloroflexi bacterium]|nr:ferredoxin--nitrite reductase [Chloroflexota bacterium]MDA1147627.1 ferredoxin--nitrite reductase [Chloroflexota bacterium]
MAVNKIEAIKTEKDGLAVLADLFRYARDGVDTIPDDDLERLKWYGLFHRKATPGFFMLRIRMPNGVLSSEQLEAIGEISNRCGRGAADITTRQAIQLRWITIEDAPWVLQRLAAAGLTSQQSGMDNVRNVTGCPLAGLDADELYDAGQLAMRLQQAIIGHDRFSNLPRKFSIAISGCREDCIHAQTNDLSFVPATRPSEDGPPRVGFNVLVGGALGGAEPELAQPLDAFVEPAEVVPLADAILATFRDHGSRESRKTARLKFLLRERGIEGFRAIVADAYCAPIERAGEPATNRHGGDHIGLTTQRQAGRSVVGCLVPVGRASGDALIEFGRLASVYGTGEVRLTVQQNVLIPGVADAVLGELLAEPLLDTYSPSPSNWIRSLVTCTGNDFCHFAQTDTKGDGIRLAEALDARYEIDTPVRIQVSGCPHACGQHRAGEIGLLGGGVRVDGVVESAAAVFVGGRLGEDARLAEQVASGVLQADLPEVVADQVRALRGAAAVRPHPPGPHHTAAGAAAASPSSPLVVADVAVPISAVPADGR